MKHILFVLCALSLLVSCSGSKPREARFWKKTVEKQLSPGAFREATVTEGQLVLRYENLQVRCRFFNEGNLHLQADWGEKPSRQHSYAVVNLRETPATAVLTNGRYRLTLGDRELEVTPAPLQLTLRVAGKPVFRSEATPWQLCITEEQVFRNDSFHRILSSATNFAFRSSGGARYYGLGGKTGAMELTGRSFEFWNSDTYKYKKTTDPIYTSIPFYHALAGEKSHAVFTECPARGAVSFGSNVRFLIDGRRLDHYIFPGRPEAALRAYTVLTGRAAMPPLWALGFHQSRYSYMSQTEVQTVVSNFRAHNLPLDAVYLDLGFMDSNRSFTYNSKTFPDPAAMNRLLGSLGVRTVAIVDPGIARADDYPVYTSGKKLDVFVTRKAADYIGRVWPGDCVFPDFTLPAARTWWGEQYRGLLRIGTAGIWNDMNEPSVFGGPGGTMHGDARHHYEGIGALHKDLHNVYGLQLMRATHAGLKRLQPQERPFILTRAGYAGMQRYAFLWTGDNTADWDHLRMNLSMVVGLGLSGVPFSGADIGGYTGSPDAELFVRWIQLGTFLPFMRDHTETGTKPQEPYVFKEQLETIRTFMQLRYRLLPYLYTMADEATRKGTPLVRPLFWDFGEVAADHDTQFMLGPSLMVAPVLEQGKTARPVFFPPGLWYSLDGTLRHNMSGAGSTLTVQAGLESCPVFIRGGRMLPLAGGTIMHSGELGPDTPFEVVVCPDSEGLAAGRIHADDSRPRGRSGGLEMSCQVREEKASIMVAASGDRSVLPRRVRFLLPPDVRQVRINNRPVALSGRHAEWRL